MEKDIYRLARKIADEIVNEILQRPVCEDMDEDEAESLMVEISDIIIRGLEE